MNETKAKEGRARIVASTQPVPLRDVQIVIEAASEKLEIKKKIFEELAANTPETAILATNTSALPINDLAQSTAMPARVVGLHFFNPVSRMKLIEVVVGRDTVEVTRERALGFARQIGKLPVLVQDSPGFLVNRVLFPYLLDAAEMFRNGVSAEEIDGALLEWGMPMGPLRLIDEIGIDITVDIAATLEKAFGERDRAAKILQEMYAAKILGRKTGAGFYKYEGKQQTPNESLQQWRQESGEKFGLENITNRLVYLMVNEAARCLEEKVGGRGLRNGSRDRVSGLSRRSVALCGKRRPQESRDRYGRHPFPCGREIRAVRFASPALPGRNYILPREVTHEIAARSA